MSCQNIPVLGSKHTKLPTGFYKWTKWELFTFCSPPLSTGKRLGLALGGIGCKVPSISKGDAMSTDLENLKRRAGALGEAISEIVQQAYDAGFTDGGLAMREHILMRANEPVAIRAGEVRLSGSVAGQGTVTGNLSVGSSPHQRRIASRAPRGKVREVIDQILRQEPGLSIVEVEERVAALTPEVGRKSVGNQLRKYEGDLYRREGKYQWFLMGDRQEASKLPSNWDDDLDVLFPAKGGEAQ